MTARSERQGLSCLKILFVLLCLGVFVSPSDRATASQVVNDSEAEILSIQIRGLHGDAVLTTVYPGIFGQTFGPWAQTIALDQELFRSLRIPLLLFREDDYYEQEVSLLRTFNGLEEQKLPVIPKLVLQISPLQKNASEENSIARITSQVVNLAQDNFISYVELGADPSPSQSYSGDSGGVVYDSAWYNQLYRQVYKKIVDEDTKLKLVGPAISRENWEQEMPAFFNGCGDIIEVVSWRWFLNGDELTAEQILASPDDIARQVMQMRSWWGDAKINPSGYQRLFPVLFLSGFGINWVSQEQRQEGAQIEALWTAEVLARMAEAGIKMAAHAPFTGAALPDRGENQKPSEPLYAVYRMYSEWGEVLLPTSASGDAMLPVFASFRKKDSHIAVLALNKDPLAARTAHISLEDYDLDDVVEVMSLEQGVWMRQTSQQSAYEAGGSLEYTFPPYSVTLMLIKGHPRRDWWWSTIVYVLVAAVLLIYGWKHRRRNILMVEKSK